MTSTRPGFRLRPATDEDFDALYKVHVAAFRPSVEATWGWDEEVQRALFTERFDPSRSQVIVVDRTVVGHLVVEKRAGEVFLARIALLPQWQGQGIGTCIIEDVLVGARDAGLPLHLHVLRANPRARELYLRLGFRVTGGDDHRHYMSRPAE